MPGPFVWNETWYRLMNPHDAGVSTNVKIGLGIGLGGLGLILVISIIVASIAKYKYHFVFIQKGDVKNDDWDNGSNREHGGGIGRVLPCCRTT
jgi:hypothetical protein